MKFLYAHRIGCLALLLGLGLAPLAHAEEIAKVNTNWKLLGSDKVIVDAYDDPKVKGVACYVSRAKTGGFSGAIGVAEDKFEASIACIQNGPIQIITPLKQQEEAFSERLSLVFKEMHVIRIVDTKRNTLVYFTYSDRVISGSPKSSVSAVPVNGAIPLK